MAERKSVIVIFNWKGIPTRFERIHIEIEPILDDKKIPDKKELKERAGKE